MSMAEISLPAVRISAAGSWVCVFSIWIHLELAGNPQTSRSFCCCWLKSFIFLRIWRPACTHANSFKWTQEGGERTDACIQKDQQINNSEWYDSRCLGGRVSAVVSATTFDQKFKNRPCVADRRLSSSSFCLLLIPDIFLGRLFSGRRREAADHGSAEEKTVLDPYQGD